MDTAEVRLIIQRFADTPIKIIDSSTALLDGKTMT